MFKFFCLLALFSYGRIRLNKELVEEIPRIEYIYHWEDKFSKEEKIKLTSWVNEINLAVVKTIGKYEFDVHLYFHRTDNKKEPVPWAHTDRYQKQSVHFHVNPDFKKEVFLKDWTAAHEISHLSIPFVGSGNMWFSEGYASFMQVQIMHQQGIYTKEEMVAKYKSKFDMCFNSFQSEDPFPELSSKLKKSYNYPHLYWGGAYFFKLLDAKLQEKENITLLELIQKYQSCCRVKTQASTPEEVIKSWDEILNTKVCSDFFNRFVSLPASTFM